MKKLFILFILSVSFITSVYSQKLTGNISSSIYSFERFSSPGNSEKSVRLFQLLNLNFSKNDFTVKTYLNLENDFSQNLVTDPRLRLYNFYVEGRNIFDIVTLRLGRQPLFNSLAGGIFDGINIGVKTNIISIKGYYGANVPAYQKFEVVSNWSDNFILGGKISTDYLTNTNISISYINKNFKPQDYVATRLDLNLNPIQVLISNKSNQYQYAQTEINYNLPNVFTLNTRYDYDLNFSKTSRFQIDGEYTELKDFTFRMYYNYRAPNLRYNSIFSVFDYGNTNEIEGGIDYKINDKFTLSGLYGVVNYKDDKSQRFTLGLISNLGTISYRKSTGYAGELDALSFYSAYSFLEGKLTPSIGISYTNYKLSENSSKNNLTTILTGINFRPEPRLSFDLQLQYLNSEIYKNDSRFYFRVNYWFNTKL